MADAGKEAAPEVTPTAAATPSPNASVKMACAHPTHRFVAGEDIPVITRAGVMLTKAQAKAALKAAEGCRVRLDILEGEVN